MYMNPFDKFEDPRRRVLINMLSAGFGASSVGAMAASIFGSPPSKLPAGQSVYRVEGTVAVNDKPATLQTRINAGDTVQTGAKSEIVFVVGGHSMLVRDNSRMTIESKEVASAKILSGLRLLAGKVLSVSRNSPMVVSAPTVTIGLRGTGFYLEADPEQAYFCTCYGSTEVHAVNDPDSKEIINATRHDRPIYILAKAARGKNIRNAPFVNHTDQELMLIETLVGRNPPFVFPKDSYTGPRRNY